MTEPYALTDRQTLNNCFDDEHLETLSAAIQACECVSLDLFDTLIFRCVDEPTRVFDLVEDVYNSRHEHKIHGFHRRRVHAEQIARRKRRPNEVDIRMIYKELGYRDRINVELMEIEKETEIRYCVPNRRLINFLNKICADKRVVVTSDMYLDEKTIEHILLKTGIRYSKLFLSCVHYKTKFEGSLFHEVTDWLGVKPSQVLHIGDNARNDVSIPLSLGFHAMQYISADRSYISYGDSPYSSGIAYPSLCEFIKIGQTENIIDCSQPGTEVGFSILGPFITSYCKWLHSTLDSEDACITFLSREGYLLKQAYDILYPQANTKYISINNNIVRLPLLYCVESPNVFIDALPYKKSYSIEYIMSLVGLEESQYPDALEKLELHGGERFDRNGLLDGQLQSIVLKLKDIQQEYLREHYNLLVQYLQENLGDSQCIYLVNNSINGTAQFALQSMDAGNRVYEGRNFSSSQKCAQKLKGHYKTFLDAFQVDDLRQLVFQMFSVTFEHLLFPSNGTALRLYKDESDEVQVAYDVLGQEMQNIERVESIQKAALDYVRFVRDNDYYDGWNQSSIDRYFTFFMKPMKQHASYIGSLYDRDADGTKILIGLASRKEKSLSEMWNEMQNGSLVKWPYGYCILQSGGERLVPLYNAKRRLSLIYHRYMDK